MSRAREAERLLREIHDWFDADHLRLDDGTCEECGLDWPCPPAKIVAFFDETNQCRYCYRAGEYRFPDESLLCEPCRKELGIAKQVLRPRNVPMSLFEVPV